MLALAVPQLPEGPAWAYELKLDAYGALGLMVGSVLGSHRSAEPDP
jgi:hypothetical protein